MKSFGILFYLAFVLSAHNVYAVKNKRCSKNTVCIHTEQVAALATVEVENLALYPVTVTLDITVKGWGIDTLKPVQATYWGQSTELAVKLNNQAVGQLSSWTVDYAWQRGVLNAKHDDAHVYLLPFAPGSVRQLSQSFNGKLSHYDGNQFGLDFAMPIGTTIHAARAGKVVGIRQDSNRGCPKLSCRNDANYVFILHSDNTLGEYFHLKYKGVLVKLGQQVEAGQAIALSGNTGWSGKPHLHFSVHSATSQVHRRSHPILLKTEWGILSHPVVGKIFRAVK